LDLKKILIVEDELLIAKVYSMFLQRMGYTVLPVLNDGNVAVEKFPESGADIILMDVHLKNNTSGFEAAKQIREKSDVPIIFTTGNSIVEANRESGEIKNTMVLIKPVEPSEIDRMIKKYFASL
jgi:two-component system, response regulator PdtaR